VVGKVAAGGVDDQHLGGDRQGANGILEQGSFPEGEQCWAVGPAGGPYAAHPGQQAAAVPDRCPDAWSPAAPAPWTRPKQTKQAPVRNTFAGGRQCSGVISRGVSQLTSSRCPLILVNQSTEDLATTQVSKSHRTCWVTTHRRYGRAQAEAAVRAVLVVVLNIGAQDVNKMLAANDQ
jgi:hypothetical protein